MLKVYEGKRWDTNVFESVFLNKTNSQNSFSKKKKTTTTNKQTNENKTKQNYSVQQIIQDAAEHNALAESNFFFGFLFCFLFGFGFVFHILFMFTF